MASTSSILAGLAVTALFAVSTPPEPAAKVGIVNSKGPVCNGVVVDRTVWMMGTTLDATACASERGRGIAALEDAFQRVREVEGRLSTWDDHSELSDLNAAPAGTWVKLSPPTVDLLADVRRWVVTTDGAFDPAVGAAIEAWDLRGDGRTPTPSELAEARRAAGPSAWVLDVAGRRARRAPGVRLDAGAFGKGAGLRAAIPALDRDGVYWAVLDFGGQLLITSADPTLRWPVAVADPRRRDRPTVHLEVGPGSLATSGASERFVETAAGRIGHVIDPRTARPVPAWGSITVLTPDPLDADILSTGLFVGGPEAAIVRAQHLADVEVLTLETARGGLAVRHTAGLDGAWSFESDLSTQSSNSRE